MVKVRLITSTEQKTDLFSEHTLLREMFNHFCVDPAISIMSANGTLLQESDLDKPLIPFADNAELTVRAIQCPCGEDPKPQGNGTVAIDDGKAEVLKALMKAREALNEAMDIAVKVLGIVPIEESPF